ncbi:MAG: TolC family protein, partial [Psychroflexus sp.]|nr:TolC family protein [Psychroflexus sp.]
TDILDKSPQEIITKAKEERYEVKVAEQQRDMAEKNVEITRSNYYPTLSAFINYNTRESDRNRVVQSGIDPDNPTTQIGVVEGTNQAVVAPNFAFETLSSRSFVDQLWRNDGLSYGLQLSIPVFNGFQVRHQVAKQKINAERAEFQLEQAKLDLESDVYQAFVDAQGALKTYEAALESVNAQQTAYNYAQERFDVGVSNAFDLTQSKFRLTDAENNLINAKYDYIFKLKVLELYFGLQIVEY